jgi:glutathione S-transferase
MNKELILYTNSMSRGRIVRWMLEEIGAPYRTELLAYGPTMKTEKYLALNPMGKVPTLVHGSAVVTETAAICAYLADAFPAAKLARPLDSRGSYYRWLFFAAGALLKLRLQISHLELRCQLRSRALWGMALWIWYLIPSSTRLPFNLL